MRLPYQSFKDEPTIKDQLEIENYINGLSSFISSCETPLTIAIQGDWGTGKTSIMKQVEIVLNDSSKKIKPIFFNTWQYSQFQMSDELCISLISDLIHQLHPENSVKNNTCKKLIDSLKYLSIPIPLINTEKLTDDITDFISQKYKNRTESIKELKDNFQILVNEYIKNHYFHKIVIFIDDLDRLVPEKAVELLEVLKLFLDCENCVFVLAIDYNVVVRGAKSKYGADFDEMKGRAFFDKIIQVPFTVPVSNYKIEKLVEESIQTLGFTKSDPNLITNLIKASIGNNPRSINRLFNSTSLLLHIMNKEQKELDVNLILGIVCLQLAYENIYNWILDSYNKISKKDEIEFEKSLIDLIEILEKNFPQDSIYSLQYNFEEDDLGNFQEFYQFFKEIWSQEENDFSYLIEYMLISNTVATGNSDLSLEKQNHTTNEDVQFVIRKLYNSLTDTHKIDLDNPHQFGKEKTREDQLNPALFDTTLINRVRITRGKGQGLNLFSKEDSSPSIYLSGDAHGNMINDGLQFNNFTGVLKTTKNKNHFSCTDAKILREDNEKYQIFEKEVHHCIRQFLDQFKKS